MKSCMRVTEILAFLWDERDRIDNAIAALEKLRGARKQPAEVPRRGRTSMPPDERKRVSLRMKRYWASWRRLADVPAEMTGELRVEPSRRRAVKTA